MRLTFIGTRGFIDSSNVRHRRHTSTLVTYRNKRVMIDCGEDWFNRFEKLEPQAIVITHAHPDHVFGLKAGTPCPVYAIQETWEKIRDFPIKQANKSSLGCSKT